MRARLELERLFKQFTKKIGLPWPNKLIIAPPKDKRFGDLAANLPLVLTKEAKCNSSNLACQAREFLLANSPDLMAVEIAGPGFLNCTFSPSFWQATVLDILESEDSYGKVDLGHGKRIQIEFVSANPTGPLHVGHGRCAAIGDSLARILRFAGYNVSREYYLNDAGRQMQLLGLSVWCRVQQSAGRDIILPDECYQGNYITDIAVNLLTAQPELVHFAMKRETEAVEICRIFALHAIAQRIKDDLANFNVIHDVWYSEQSLLTTGAVDKTLERLRAAGLAFEADGALWFRTGKLGDKKDRVLRKSDGSITYFASDIAYHANKYDRGFDLVIDIWGTDHHGYLPRMQAATKALGRPAGSLIVILVQLVRLLDNGKPLSMSTRAGTFETLADVCREVGSDAARFIFLSRKSDSTLDFDLELAKRKSMDNPVYYVQYAHARIRSIQRKAKDLGLDPEPRNSLGLKRLNTAEDLELLRLLERYPEAYIAAAELLSPHYVTYYLLELAAMLHRYYTIQPVLTAGETDLVTARLALMAAVARVLKNGLGLLGVAAPEKM